MGMIRGDSERPAVDAWSVQWYCLVLPDWCGYVVTAISGLEELCSRRSLWCLPGLAECG